MTYQPPNQPPNLGHHQQPQQGFPHPPGVHWPAAPAPTPPPTPPGRRRPALLIAILIALLAAAGGVVTLVLTSGNDNSKALTKAAGGSATDSSRPLPPPTPTGRLYEKDDPKIGECADLSRQPTGVSIYEADCDNPAATLILESIQPGNEKCPGKRFFGLDSLDKKLLCFTYNFQAGDCVDMHIPRRVACTAAPTGDKPVVTIAEIQVGQHDGAGCADPAEFLQVGKDNQRGIACLVTKSTQNTTSQPTG